MKTETKFLIVAIIMILSVGPMSYFFSTQPQQIISPDKNETVTSYTFSGNVTGTIIDMDPYIYFAGISNYNRKDVAQYIIESIPEIDNYSIDVSLNPNGNGYKYSIAVPVNDSTLMKRIGFRLAWRFNEFFNQATGSIPYVHGTIQIPQNFTIDTVNRTVNASAKENQTLTVYLLYSKAVGNPAQVYCQQMVTSLTYYLVKTPNYCFDTGMLTSQNYLGLSLMDVIFIKPQQTVLNLEVTQIGGFDFRGKYSFAGIDSVSTAAIEEQTNSSILLVPEENTNNTRGNFSIKAAYNGMDDIARIKAIFAKNNFTIEKEYKDALIKMPDNVTLDGTMYDNFNIRSVWGQIGMNDGVGFYNFNVNMSIIYDEITNAVVSKVNLS